MTNAELLESLRGRPDTVLVFNAGNRWTLEMPDRKPEHFPNKHEALNFVFNNGHDSRNVLVVVP
jgi:hypothetical protein